MSVDTFLPMVYPLNLEEWGINKDFQEPEETTAAFNKAFEYAKSMGYFKILVPPGNFLIDAVSDSPYRQEDGGGIRLHSNSHYILHPESVFKVNANDAQGYSIFYIGLAYNVTLEGGQLIGDRHDHDYSTITPTRDTHEWGFGVHVHGSERVNIVDISSKDMTGDNVYIANHGLMNYPGQVYRPSKNVYVEKCFLETARRNNLSAIGCDYVTIHRCVFERAGGGTIGPQLGIDFEGYAENGVRYAHPYSLKVTKCNFIDNTNGDLTAHAAGTVSVDDNEGNGRMSYGYGTDISFTNNKIINRSGTIKDIGIDSIDHPSYDEHNRVHIAGNEIRGFQKGIAARGRSINISDNQIYDVTNAGIYAYMAEDVEVNNNKVDSDCLPLYVHFSKRVKASGNTLKGGADKYAVKVANSSDVSLSDNNLRSSGGGVLLSDSQNVRVLSDNEIFPGEGNAIKWDSKSECFVDGAKIYEPKQTAIVGDGTNYYASIQNVDIRNSKSQIGISLMNGKNHDILRNNITFNRDVDGGYGVYIEGTDKVLIQDNTVKTLNDKNIASPLYTSKSQNSKLIRNTYNSGAIWKNKDTDSDIDNIPV